MHRNVDHVFPHGVGPRHVLLLGALLLLGGLVVPGVGGDGVILLLVADLWWIGEHAHGRPRADAGPSGPA